MSDPGNQQDLASLSQVPYKKLFPRERQPSKQESKSGFTFKPHHDLLLRGTDEVKFGLYHLRIATADQLCRLHYSMGSLKTIKARLKELTDAGYIQSDRMRTKVGSGTFYYALASGGASYLSPMGYDIDQNWRPGRGVDKGELFLDHTLELNDVIVAAALVSHADPQYQLTEMTHEHALKRRPYKAKWKLEGASHTFTVIPDALLEFHHTLNDGRQRRMPVLLEHDKGTEEQVFFRKRIRAYIAMLTTEAYQTLFGSRAVTVVFTTFVGDHRVEQMRNWTRAELEHTHVSRSLGLVFRFATLDKPLDPAQTWFGQQWYTPYDEDMPTALLA